MKPRRAERAGANRCAAACGGGRRGGEVKKQGAARSAPSEQFDYVSEGQLQVLLPLPSAINPNFITVIGDAFGFIVFISN